ncbi:histidine--tRNA ligase [Candidatus Uhrbacteria bacterium]|nr:histidine--tRNA ligase [Candidatus Uhrbacteria bacterium]
MPPKPTKKSSAVTPPAPVKPARPMDAKGAPASPPAGAVPEEAPRIPTVQLLRGMKDIMPSDQPHWDRVRTLVEELAQAYGYGRIDTPILEDTQLFTRAVGRATDIVEKEMFSFADQGGDHVSLRPEGTAGVVRAYVEHGMVNQPQPVKLWYTGPMFRYDRPQSGRLRQFHQFGLEILGEMHPATDAELITMGANLFSALAIPVSVQVNSIGCALCRPAYERELEQYLRTHRTDLCEDCKRRVQRGAFLRVFDCKQEECRKLHDGAPQIVDWLCEVCKKHFIRVLEYLDELEIPYALSSFLVRGLDYYTKTVFEFWPAAAAEGDAAPAQIALAAGGRYDALTEALGGRATPATGIAFGIERIILKMKEAIAAGRLVPPQPVMPTVYLAQLGDQAKRKAMKLFEQLRREGLTIAANFAKDSLKGQLEHANRLGVRLTLILGQKEVIDGTMIIREMSSGIQEIIAFEKVVPEVRKRLEQEAVKESKTEVIPEAPTAAPEPESAALKDLPPPSTLEEFEPE